MTRKQLQLCSTQRRNARSTATARSSAPTLTFALRRSVEIHALMVGGVLRGNDAEQSLRQALQTLYDCDDRGQRLQLDLQHLVEADHSSWVWLVAICRWIGATNLKSFEIVFATHPAGKLLFAGFLRAFIKYRGMFHLGGATKSSCDPRVKLFTVHCELRAGMSSRQEVRQTCGG